MAKKKKKKEKDKEKYVLTPLRIAKCALLAAGLADSLNDSRIDNFWEAFEKSMRKHGYIKDD